MESAGVGIGRNYSYYVKNDHLMFAVDNWQNKFYGIRKGEKEMRNYYKRIVTINTK